MTAAEAQITHILEVCPRGFSNEITILAVPHEYALVAETFAAKHDFGGNGWACAYTWSEAPSKFRSQVGYWLKSMDARLLAEVLPGMMEPFFQGGDESWDYENGQWVPATTTSGV